jgi:protease IV
MDLMRESIFAGALRSFCKSIATILGIAIGIGFVAIGIGVLIGPNMLPPKSQPLLMPDASGNRTILNANAPVILRLDFHGVIGVGDLTADKIENLLLDSQEDLFKGGRVKAVLLHMDTGGGAASDSDTIYRALMTYKKKYNVPIYAYIDGMCASGGMYIASAADKIYSSHASVIGSIGVRLGPNFNFADAMTNYGVKALTLTEGKDKDFLNPFRPWKPDEDAPLKDVMAALYDQFITIVSESRPKLTKELLINTYGAHIFIAKDAEQNGYIDAWNSNYSEAIQALATAAQIGENDHYQVIQLTPPRAFFSDMAQSVAPVKVIKSLFGKDDITELNGKFLYYYQP